MAMINAATPFQNISAASVSGATTFTSSASNIMYLNDVGLQFSWTGNPTGTFFVQGSIDYNPGAPQTRGTANTGSWLSVTLDPVPTTASGSSYMVNMSGLAFPWMRIFYTNSTGSGTISSYFCAKSQG